MADGYARVSGAIRRCAGTSGPGATNLHDRRGLRVLRRRADDRLDRAGQQRRVRQGAAQETTREDIDIVSMFRPVTKYSAMVTSGTSFAHHLRRALRQALTGRPGPVHLNVPVDVWDLAAPADDGSIPRPTGPRPTPSTARPCSARLRRSSTPSTRFSSRAPASRSRRQPSTCARSPSSCRRESRGHREPRGSSPRIIRCRSACSASPATARRERRCSATRSTCW